ncbi:MAG: cobyric acid synthase [Beijerinckiaceae bacterium]|nr:cobyric acid synthase [Beijerinckiaceae bacterium]MCZ8299984.1 cobyric acid synthase [Beijerinckiaceae bacterium]
MARRAAAIMLQGTGSNVGKSTLVAGLCRLFADRGLVVRPFKPQNMSNNAAIAREGGEIGRAQAVQARAARCLPSIHMNPILLKPETDTGSQVIVQGQRRGSLRSLGFGARRDELFPAVMESFGILEDEADLVIVEGAGSPAEINLRAGDIANMGFAAAADVPVLLVGDIDRGGVIASLVGTHAILPEEDRRMIKAFAINKFRGDAKLFEAGMQAIESFTGWPGLGIVPWFAEAHRLPAEDALDLEERRGTTERPLRIAVPILARIANFDDLDPLSAEPAVELTFIPPGRPLPANADLVILPGSKATLADLAFLREQGWDIDLAAHHRRGGCILGLCGGYQMLGTSIADPEGIEGRAGTVPGLGFLGVETRLTPDKITRQVEAEHTPSGQPIRGYEIHLGRTEGPDGARPFARIEGRPDGAISADGRVQGTYLHGLFSGDAFRAAFLAGLGAGSALAYEAEVEAVLDRLARHCEAYLDTEAILRIARSRQRER